MSKTERDHLAAHYCPHCKAKRRLRHDDVYGWIHPGGVALFDKCGAAEIHATYESAGNNIDPTKREEPKRGTVAEKIMHNPRYW